MNSEENYRKRSRTSSAPAPDGAPEGAAPRDADYAPPRRTASAPDTAPEGAAPRDADYAPPRRTDTDSAPAAGTTRNADAYV
ncbi:MAG: hypothetical protein ACI4L8_09095, partial [Candidatus Fimadaptatus sp.]